MPNTVISVENLIKSYDLGVISTGTLSRDLNRWWARLRHQPDPYTRIGKEDPFKRHGESILALDDVSFTVQQGEALGIIGKNGAGKSTLLKILSRVTAPTSGVVKVKGRIGSLLEVGTGFHPELTGRENVFLNGAILGMRNEEVQRKFDEIVDFSGVEKFIDTPVKRYSSGMYVRLAFAVAAHLDPEILVVDEVLAVGDAEFQKKCLGKMGDVAGEGRTILFVSHNMMAIEHLCNYCMLLQNGIMTQYGHVKNVVSEYLFDFDTYHSSHSGKTNILYRERNLDQSIAITDLELLTKEFQPKNTIYTWDSLVFKIGFYSKYQVKNASVVLQVFDKYENSLLLLSTQPDSKLTMDFEEGENCVYCIIDNLPLSAGQYTIGCGLAIPNKEYLWKKDDLARLIIKPKDVYNSGLAPTLSRSLLAVKHKWIINNELD
jgi:lipopolysaccharide transport system ATP-binding protein